MEDGVSNLPGIEYDQISTPPKARWRCGSTSTCWRSEVLCLSWVLHRLVLVRGVLDADEAGTEVSIRSSGPGQTL
jgi:hypothetical protein